ncbi:MAG: carbohydrate ABC transporter permease [Spirochaetaceae bacterium]|nr:carbohydrate ABC transporter permease [Spirochaetaceae bacterium]
MATKAIAARDGAARPLLPFKYLFLSLWSLLVLFPIWTMVANSFKLKNDIYLDPFGLPRTWNFAGYATVFEDSPFPRYFLNSLAVTTISLALIILLGSLAAYACVRWRSRYSRWIYLFFLAGLTVPIKIGSVNLLQIMISLGLLDSTWSVVPVYVAMGLPIAVFTLYEFIKGIPVELTEAALIDGAGPLLIYRSIIVRLVRPAIATVAIFNLVPIWNDLWFPLIFIRKDDQRTLILGVTRLFGEYQTDWSKILAVLSLSCVPVILLYLGMAKQFISGLTAGAVKG